MAIVFKAYKPDDWWRVTQFVAAEPPDIAEAKQAIRDELWPSINDRALRPAVDDLDKDMQELVHSLAEHRAKTKEWQEHLDKTVRGPHKDGRGGLVRSVADQAAALAAANAAAEEKLAGLRSDLAKACNAFGQAEGRLRLAIENGEWRGVFIAQVEKTIGELDRMVTSAHRELDKDIQAIQTEVAETRALEAVIRNTLSNHEERVAAVLGERGNEFRQRCQELCTQAQEQATAAFAAREQALGLVNQVREDLGKVLEAAREVERWCRTVQDYRRSVTSEAAVLVLAAVVQSLQSVRW